MRCDSNLAMKTPSPSRQPSSQDQSKQCFTAAQATRLTFMVVDPPRASSDWILGNLKVCRKAGAVRRMARVVANVPIGSVRRIGGPRRFVRIIHARCLQEPRGATSIELCWQTPEQSRECSRHAPSDGRPCCGRSPDRATCLNACSSRSVAIKAAEFASFRDGRPSNTRPSRPRFVASSDNRRERSAPRCDRSAVRTRRSGQAAIGLPFSKDSARAGLTESTRRLWHEYPDHAIRLWDGPPTRPRTSKSATPQVAHELKTFTAARRPLTSPAYREKTPARQCQAPQH
jgi:hypothetical protein